MPKYWKVDLTEEEQWSILKNITLLLINKKADFSSCKAVRLQVNSELEVVVQKTKLTFNVTPEKNKPPSSTGCIKINDLPLMQKKYMERMMGFMSRGKIVDFHIKRVEKPEVHNA